MQELQGRADPGPGQIGYVVARSMSVGIPIPDSILHAHLVPSRLGKNPSLLQLKGTALYLIEQGRAAELGPLLDRIRAKTGPDAQVVRELKGYRAFRAGALERAAALWADVGESTFWVYGSIWRGDLHRRLGQLERAEGWYQAAWQMPLAHERLGTLYEKMGKPGKTAAAYERFLEAWKNADPVLQDRVTKARERLEALGKKSAE